MTIIMLIMMFTLLLLLASQGSLALVPEGMWHNNNNNNNNNIPFSIYIVIVLYTIADHVGETIQGWVESPGWNIDAAA